MGEITELLRAAHAGDRDAAARIYDELYGTLRRLARARLRDGGRDAVLDTTAVVHESFLRMHEAGRVAASDRSQFLAYASRAMRSVVVDFVRRRIAARRGGGVSLVSLPAEVEAAPARSDEILRVHEALDGLERLDPDAAAVVEMRYFSGLAVPEIAAALGTSVSTVERRWRAARAFLFASLR
ncbi:MAG TPA: ECF-type sigma factor [Candidatus Polarisedimenticolaceae bacterium]|nr:ECF-type sigma factor [Candidatus Polarisedimenticolaceae bacterium]